MGMFLHCRGTYSPPLPHPRLQDMYVFMKLYGLLSHFMNLVLSDANEDSTSDIHGSYAYICIINSKYDRGLNFRGMMLIS